MEAAHLHAPLRRQGYTPGARGVSKPRCCQGGGSRFSFVCEEFTRFGPPTRVQRASLRVSGSLSGSAKVIRNFVIRNLPRYVIGRMTQCGKDDRTQCTAGGSSNSASITHVRSRAPRAWSESPHSCILLLREISLPPAAAARQARTKPPISSAVVTSGI